MTSRGRRTQERAMARHLRNAQKALAEKRRRDARRAEKERAQNGR